MIRKSYELLHKGLFVIYLYDLYGINIKYSALIIQILNNT